MYYILANQLDGELIQVSNEPLTPGEHQIMKVRQGDIPDLARYEWHGGSLAFIEKNSSRILTKLSFMRRFSSTELAGIYTAAKSNVLMEIWLDKFKVAEEINLEDQEIIEGLQMLEASGLLAEGRAAEVLA